MKKYMSGVLFGLLIATTRCQQPVSQCQDVHTESCIHFHDARPDLCSDPTFADNMCKRFCGNCPLECYSCPHAVLHPEDCNTTTACDQDMQCATRHLKAKDGHHEYVMSCEATELCQLILGSFGKRDMNDISEMLDESSGRYERDVVMSCCDTDLCNAQVTTTTKSTTTTTTSARPTTTIQSTSRPTTPATTTPDPGCKKDVVLVLQNIVHTTSHNGHYGMVTDWINSVQRIVSNINVGPNTTHVAAVTFDSHSKVEWTLNHYSSESQVHNAVAHLKNHRIVTTASLGSNPDGVFDQVISHVFEHGSDDRADAENVVVVLEHGAFNGRLAHASQHVAELHATSNNVILVSVKKDPDSHHYGFATDTNHELKVDNYGSLPSIIPQIVKLICS